MSVNSTIKGNVTVSGSLNSTTVGVNPDPMPTLTNDGDIQYDQLEKKFKAKRDGVIHEITLGGDIIGKTVYVDALNPRSTDTRSGLSDYSFDRPFLTLQSGINALKAGDILYIKRGTYTPTVGVDFIFNQDIYGPSYPGPSVIIFENSTINGNILDAGGNGSYLGHWIGIGKSTINGNVSKTYAISSEIFKIENLTINGYLNNFGNKVFKSCIFPQFLGNNTRFYGHYIDCKITVSPITDNYTFWNSIFENCDFDSSSSILPYIDGNCEFIVFRNCRMKLSNSGFLLYGRSPGIKICIINCEIEHGSSFYIAEGGHGDEIFIIKNSSFKHGAAGTIFSGATGVIKAYMYNNLYTNSIGLTPEEGINNIQATNLLLDDFKF